MLNPVLWIHGEALGPTNPGLVAYPGAPAVFVFDRQLIAQAGLSLKRLGFIYECLLELPVTLRHGDVAEEVLAFARRHRADGVATTSAVDPRFAGLQQRIAAQLPVARTRALTFCSRWMRSTRPSTIATCPRLIPGPGSV